MSTILNGVLELATGASLKNLHVEQQAGLPAHTAADEGRVVYDSNAEDLYVGLSGSWKKLSQVLSAGDGLDLATETLSVDVTDFIDTASGLAETTNDIQVALESDGGLQFDGTNGGVEILLDGTTLSLSASGLKVAASGITETELNTSVAGGGLTGGGGSALAVGAGTGITVNADDVAIDTSGNVTFASGASYDFSAAAGTLVAASPSADADVATKGYVDAVAEGLDVKESVRAASDGVNVDLASATDPNPVDGVNLSNGDRVLLKDQTTGSENGIYVANTAADPTTWTRAADFDEDAEVTAGAFTFVEEGTANGDAGFVLTTDDPITVGSTALVFSQFSGAGSVTAGQGLTKSGDTLNVGDADKGVQVNSTNLEIDGSEVAANGLKEDTTNSWQLAVEPADFAGTGLEDDGADNLRIAAGAAGAGLTGGGGSALAVNAGDGIDVGTITADAVSVDVTAIIDTAAGLTETTNDIQVALESDGGLQFDGTNGGIEILLDGSSLSLSASGLRVASGGITGTELNSSVAGDGLAGGGGSALSVNAGDGIDVGTIVADSVSVDVTNIIDTTSGLTETSNDIQINLESNGGLQFDATNNGVEIKLADNSVTTTTSGLAVVVDDTTIQTGASGLEVKDAGITSAKLASGSVIDTKLAQSAIDTVLSDKFRPGWDQVSDLTTGSPVQSTAVDTEVTSAATTDTSETDFTTAKGVYTGYNTGVLPVRDSSTNDPVTDGSGNEVYGRLTNKHPSAQPSNITGVTITFAGDGSTEGGTLQYTNSTTSLTWDGGTAVDVSAGGYFILEGSSGKASGVNYLVVDVTPGSLPGSDQSDTINFGAGYRIGYFSNVSDTETPYEFSTSDTIDFLFIEIFDLRDVPASAVLNGVAFGDLLSITSHNHDGRYYTESELGSTTSPSGASLIGIDNTSLEVVTGTEVQTAVDELDADVQTRTKKFSDTFTAATTWTVSHNLGTTDVDVSIYDDSTPRNEVIPDNVELTDNNTVTVSFASSQAGKAVVVGL